MTNLSRAPKELYRWNNFLEKSKNLKLVEQCIENQKSVSSLDIDGVTISNEAAKTLLEEHYIYKIEITQLPTDLFKNSTFLQSEENIDTLC